MPIKVSIGKATGTNSWLTMRLKEGKNREIRKVCKFVGLEVNRLIRTSYGPFDLADLKKKKLEKFQVFF